MTDELTEKLSSDVPDTEPTISTLMERLRSMQDTMDRRHLETQALVNGVKDDINSVKDDINSVKDDINSVRDDITQRMDQKHELLVNRIELLRSETDAHFRKQAHVIRALNDAFLETRGDHRELFERVAALEERVIKEV